MDAFRHWQLQEDRRERRAARRTLVKDTVRIFGFFLPKNCTDTARFLLQFSSDVFGAPLKADIDQNIVRARLKGKCPLRYNAEYTFEVCFIIFTLATGKRLPFVGTTPELSYLDTFLMAYDPMDLLNLREEKLLETRIQTQIATALSELQHPDPLPGQVQLRQLGNIEATRERMKQLHVLVHSLRSQLTNPTFSLMYEFSSKIISGLFEFETAAIETDFALSRLFYSARHLLDQSRELLISTRRIWATEVVVDIGQGRGLVVEDIVQDVNPLFPRAANLPLLDRLVGREEVDPVKFATRTLAKAEELIQMIPTKLLHDGRNILEQESRDLLEVIYPKIYKIVKQGLAHRDYSMASEGAEVEIRRHQILTDWRNGEMESLGYHQRKLARYVGLTVSETTMMKIVEADLGTGEADEILLRNRFIDFRNFVDYLQYTLVGVDQHSIDEAQATLSGDFTLRTDMSMSTLISLKFKQKYGVQNHHNHYLGGRRLKGPFAAGEIIHERYVDQELGIDGNVMREENPVQQPPGVGGPRLGADPARVDLAGVGPAGLGPLGAGQRDLDRGGPGLGRAGPEVGRNIQRPDDARRGGLAANPAPVPLRVNRPIAGGVRQAIAVEDILDQMQGRVGFNVAGGGAPGADPVQPHILNDIRAMIIGGRGTITRQAANGRPSVIRFRYTANAVPPGADDDVDDARNPNMKTWEMFGEMPHREYTPQNGQDSRMTHHTFQFLRLHREWLDSNLLVDDQMRHQPIRNLGPIAELEMRNTECQNRYEALENGLFNAASTALETAVGQINEAITMIIPTDAGNPQAILELVARRYFHTNSRRVPAHHQELKALYDDIMRRPERTRWPALEAFYVSLQETLKEEIRGVRYRLRVAALADIDRAITNILQRLQQPALQIGNTPRMVEAIKGSQDRIQKCCKTLARATNKLILEQLFIESALVDFYMFADPQADTPCFLDDKDFFLAFNLFPAAMQQTWPLVNYGLKNQILSNGLEPEQVLQRRQELNEQHVELSNESMNILILPHIDVAGSWPTQIGGQLALLPQGERDRWEAVLGAINGNQAIGAVGGLPADNTIVIFPDLNRQQDIQHLATFLFRMRILFALMEAVVQRALQPASNIPADTRLMVIAATECFFMLMWFICRAVITYHFNMALQHPNTEVELLSTFMSGAATYLDEVRADENYRRFLQDNRFLIIRLEEFDGIVQSMERLERALRLQVPFDGELANREKWIDYGNEFRVTELIDFNQMPPPAPEIQPDANINGQPGGGNENNGNNGNNVNDEEL